jgi:hypothetical protein
MKRREFIQNTGSVLATTALIGLPQILNASNLTQDEEKIVAFESGLKSPAIEQYTYYSLSLYSSIIDNFKNADDSKKNITFDCVSETGSSIYTYKISKVKKIKGRNTTYKVQAKYQSKSANSKDVPKKFRKKLFFNIELNEPLTSSLLEIQDEKKNKITTLKPKVPKTNSGSGGAGCYITTACVVSKQLPDNCYELVTLRGFRDNYIVSIPEGKKWVQSYYNSAPNLVKRINNYENSKDIYNYIYDNLVTKSLELVESKNYDDAFHFYKDCVIKIDKMVCN